MKEMTVAQKINSQRNTRTIMDDVFSGNLKIDKPSYIPVELGYGIGIGNLIGTFNEYSNNVINKGSFRNTLVSMGKDIIQIDTGELEVHNSNKDNKYNKLDTPIIALKFFNIINSISISVLWDDMNKNDNLMPSHYLIPKPRNNGYKWWDIYDVYFYIPESISTGDHNAKIIAKDIRTLDIITSSINFSIECNKINKQDNSND